MDRKAIFALFFLTLFAFSAYAKTDSLISISLNESPGHRSKINRRSWVIGSKQKLPGGSVVAWVPEGQNVNQWQELITVQVLPFESGNSPKKFAKQMRKDILKVCRNASWETVKESSEEVLYEWQAQNCTGQTDQVEIGRIIQGSMKTGSRNIVVLQYATKNLKAGEGKKAGYWAVLKKETLFPKR